MIKKTPKISLYKGSLLTFSTSCATFIIGMASSIILARYLGPEGKGVVTLTLMFPPILMMMSTFGVEVSNVYFVGSKKYSVRDIAATSLILSVALGSMAVLFFLLVYAFPQFRYFLDQNKVPHFYLWVSVFSVFFNLANVFFRNILLGKEEIAKMNLLSIVGVFINFLSVIVLMVILNLGVAGAVWSFVLTSIITGAISVYFVFKQVPFKLGFNFELFYASIKYGGKAYIGNLAQFLNYRFDIFLVAFYLGPVAVGLYGVAVGLAERLWMIPSSMATVLFPRIASSTEAEANSITPKMARHTLLIVSLASIVLFVFSKKLINLLFGAEFEGATSALVMLLPGIVALSLCKVLTSDLAGRGKPQFGMMAAFVSLAMNIPLNIILIPRVGIVGAAFASSVAYIVSTIIVLIFFLRMSDTKLADILLIKKIDLELFRETCFRKV